MKLLDSCAWAEALTGSPTGQVFRPLLARPEALLMSSLVMYEVSKWLTRTMDSQTVDEAMVTLLSIRVVAPESSIALHAAELSVTYKLHALDALIYATALEHKAQLVTCDAHFKGLPGVDYSAKLKI